MGKYFTDWSNFISFALALIPAILLFVFQPADSVPYIVFIVTLFFTFLLAWLSFKLFYDLRNASYQKPIELISCVNNRCICKPSHLVSHHSMVSFFKEIDGFEELIAYGYVETITNKGLIQVNLLMPEHTKNDVYAYITEHKNIIIIKPTISVDMIDTVKLDI